MKYLLSICVTLSLVGCCKQTYTKFDYNNSENAWIDAFKDQVFISCLKESYKNDTIFRLIDQEDAFNPYDGLNGSALKLARESGVNIIKNIPQPRMCEGCNEGENYYMASCLHYYKSAELDSLASAEYKKTKK